MSADDTATVSTGTQPTLAISVLEPYCDSLWALKTALDDALKQKKASTILPQQVSRALSTRDLLEVELEKMTTVSGDVRLGIVQADRELRIMLNQVLEHQWIDLAAWRGICSKGTDAKWWWHLDQERLTPSASHGLDLRQILYGIIALFLLLGSVDIIYETANRVASLIVSTFVGIGAAQIGLDVVTFITIILQLIFGERVSTAFASKLTRTVNETIVGILFGSQLPSFPRIGIWVDRLPFKRANSLIGRRIISPLRNFLNWLFLSVRAFIVWAVLPVSRFFVGTLVFLGVVLLIRNVGLRLIANDLRELAVQVQQSPESRLNTFESAFSLDPEANADSFALELTQVGLNYESVGNYEQALEVYARVLTTSPHQVYSAYRLAVVSLLLDSLDRTKEMHVIDVIDQALHTIDTYRTNGLALSDINIRDDTYVTQLNVLLLINRAKLFTRLGLPQGAIQDLIAAEGIALKNPDLFKLPGIAQTAAATTRISTVELYYLLAKNYEQLATSPNPNRARGLADDAWLKVIGLADKKIGRELIWSIEADSASRSRTAHD